MWIIFVKHKEVVICSRACLRCRSCQILWNNHRKITNFHRQKTLLLLNKRSSLSITKRKQKMHALEWWCIKHEWIWLSKVNYLEYNFPSWLGLFNYSQSNIVIIINKFNINITWRMFKLPMNRKGVVFQGPRSIPKYTKFILMIYGNHFCIFINP